MRTVTTNVFQYSELSDKAKERAREWFREDNSSFEDHHSDNVIGDFVEICARIGVKVENTYWSGFCSQGDGASFTGFYSYVKGAFDAVRKYAPRDDELHRIAKELQNVQARHFYGLSAHITRSGRYSHEMTMDFDIERSDDKTVSEDAEDWIKESMRNLARWLYRQLEKEYDYQNSDEVVEETIEANGYEFTEDGEPA